MATTRTPKQTARAPKIQNAIKFAVADFARPRAGAALAAHTHAFLTLSGMADGSAVPAPMVRAIIGPRAVQYHKDNGNFTATDEGLILSEKGEFFFFQRGEADPELVKAYTEVMTKGTTNERANVKSEAARIALK